MLRIVIWSLVGLATLGATWIGGYVNLPGARPQSSADDVAFLTCPERLAWMEKRVGTPALRLVAQAAKEHHLDPVRPLIVLANEQADYAWSDQLQEYATVGSSFGLAQMSIVPFKSHNLLRPGDLRHPDLATFLRTGSMSDGLERTLLNKLRDPQFAATMLAREVQYLEASLSQGAREQRPFARFFFDRQGRVHTPLPETLVDVRDPTPTAQVLSLAGADFAVMAAYNSDKLLTTEAEIRDFYNTQDSRDATFLQARKHAFNLVGWSLCFRSAQGQAWIDALVSPPPPAAPVRPMVPRVTARHRAVTQGASQPAPGQGGSGPLIHQMFFDWGQSARDPVILHVRAGRGAVFPLRISVNFQGRQEVTTVTQSAHQADFTALCRSSSATGQDTGGWWSVEAHITDANQRRETRELSLVCWN